MIRLNGTAIHLEVGLAMLESGGIARLTTNDRQAEDQDITTYFDNGDVLVFEKAPIKHGHLEKFMPALSWAASEAEEERRNDNYSNS